MSKSNNGKMGMLGITSAVHASGRRSIEPCGKLGIQRACEARGEVLTVSRYVGMGMRWKMQQRAKQVAWRSIAMGGIEVIVLLFPVWVLLGLIFA